jgi:hypothetical protein
MNALAYALRAIDLGWPVLPIVDVARDTDTPAGKRGKRPAPWLAPHGVYSATLDPTVAREWFADPALGLGLVRGFKLSEAEALELLRTDYSPRCLPPWSLRELEHKVRTAAKSTRALGYLLDAPPPERPRAGRRFRVHAERRAS